MRPEVIIPIAGGGASPGSTTSSERGGVKEGDEVRLIREPYFGQLGIVKELTPLPVTIESEASVRVMQVELGSGDTVTVPRANVELIES